MTRRIVLAVLFTFLILTTAGKAAAGQDPAGTPADGEPQLSSPLIRIGIAHTRQAALTLHGNYQIEADGLWSGPTAPPPRPEIRPVDGPLAPGDTARVATAPDKLNIRSGPGTHFAVLTQVTDGTLLTVTDVQGEWAAVVLPDGQTGFAHTAWLQKVAVVEHEKMKSEPNLDVPLLPRYVTGPITAAPDSGSADGIRLTVGTSTYTARQWDLTAPPDGDFTFGGRTYRGSVRLLRRGDEVVVINILPVEEYLLGVVPLEMPSGWHPEALKAQAVAARTYAWANRGRYEDSGYDLTADTYSQVYGGKSVEQESTTAAVLATRGEVLTYGGKAISAFFSASNGGYTADPQEVWGGKLSYLSAAPDPFDAALSPHMGWSIQRSAADLASVLPAGSVLQDVVIGERGPSGRVIRLDFITDKGISSLYRDRIRSVIDAKSTLFDVEVQRSGGLQVWVLGRESTSPISITPQSAIRRGSALPEPIPAEITVLGSGRTARLSGGTGQLLVTFTGSGWGHGVGLSQYGAQARAEAGQTYREILQFYYPGAALQKHW